VISVIAHEERTRAPNSEAMRAAVKLAEPPPMTAIVFADFNLTIRYHDWVSD
jgi:hypothetical protein